MKVALYGNTCNTFFALARAIRKASAIDVHLFIDDNADRYQLPEVEDRSLRDGYPSWIHKGRYHSVGARFWPGVSPLVDALADFDAVVVSGGGVRYAPFVDAPFAFFTTGWDYTVAPFPVRFISRNPGIVRKAAHLLGGFWQRQGIEAVAQIWTQPVSCFELAGRRLRVPAERVAAGYFPVPLDTDLYRPDPGASRLDNPDVRRMVAGHDFVLFHPCSIEMRRNKWTVDTGQWRGSERLFEGFARFVAANRTARPVLVLVEKQGPGVTAAKDLFRRLRIEDHVLWLRGPHARTGFERRDLVPFYGAADAVAEDFGIGWFGATTIEGASMGKPVICYVNQAAMKQMYPWHPILAPHTPEEIGNCLAELYREPEARRRRGELSRKWAVQFHSFDAVAARYISGMEALAVTRPPSGGPR